MNFSLGAAVVPFLLQFFNFFIGTLQAFVFTLLSIVYLSLATAEEHVFPRSGFASRPRGTPQKGSIT